MYSYRRSVGKNQNQNHERIASLFIKKLTLNLVLFFFFFFLWHLKAFRHQDVEAEISNLTILAAVAGVKKSVR